ncbi:MAG: outer membrane lipoprotein-sorting protein [Bacteroidales bacterium]|nr:outer membrane lipoprotein-sorting protein [Bacteroidales bacterium]
MKNIKFLLLLISCLTTFLNLTAQEDVKDIIRKMEQHTKGDAMYAEVSMQTIRPRYMREITLKSWSLGNDYSLIFITAPARDKGIGYLKRDKEIWNYLPNIDRTIKMPPSMMSQSWMGSDFTNDDLVRESTILDDYDHRILAEEQLDGYDCWKIEMIPHPESSVVYGKVLLWVAKEYYFQVRIENYDEDDELVSTMYFKDVKLLGGREIPAVMEMVPADKPGHKTVLTNHVIDFQPKIEQSFFSIQNLKKIR